MGLKKLLFVILAQSFLFYGLPAQQAISACPCCGSEYQQLNFWLGDWVVYSKGKPVGFNKVTKLQNGCVIRESWKSIGSSYTGTSYSYYDKAASVWKQTWVDNQGAVIELSGTLKGNKMTMESDEHKDLSGKEVINRITWVNNSDGTVNQISEISDDGGISFEVIFNGLYRKRKRP